MYIEIMFSVCFRSSFTCSIGRFNSISGWGKSCPFCSNGGYFNYNQTASYLYDKKISNNLYHDTENSATTKNEINQKPNNLPNFGNNQNQSSYVDRYGNTRYLGETSSERKTAQQNLKQVDDNLDMNEFDEFIAKAKRES